MPPLEASYLESLKRLWFGKFVRKDERLEIFPMEINHDDYAASHDLLPPSDAGKIFKMDKELHVGGGSMTLNIPSRHPDHPERAKSLDLIKAAAELANLEFANLKE